jgi:hypothetical protein
MAFDVPESVVMVTGAEGVGPGSGGTTTVHVVWLGQATGATWPPTCALIWPDELKKLDPVTVTVWPARPLAGARADRAGGPLGSGSAADVGGGTGAEVEVGIEVAVGEAAELDDATPCPGAVPVAPIGTLPVAAPGDPVVAVA